MKDEQAEIAMDRLLPQHVRADATAYETYIRH